MDFSLSFVLFRFAFTSLFGKKAKGQRTLFVPGALPKD